MFEEKICKKMNKMRKKRTFKGEKDNKIMMLQICCYFIAVLMDILPKNPSKLACYVSNHILASKYATYPPLEI